MRKKIFIVALIIMLIIILVALGTGSLQYFIGRCLQDMMINKQEVFKWYTRAAEMGHSGGQYALGLMYYHGEGVPQDYNEAFKWYKKTAEQRIYNPDSYNAAFGLGEMYATGKGVQKDYREAIWWFNERNRTAKVIGMSEEPPSDFTDDNYYKYLLGLEDDKDKILWLQQCAVSSHYKSDDYKSAYLKLGKMYYLGKGVERDYKKAFDYYNQASWAWDNGGYIPISIDKMSEIQYKELAEYLAEYLHNYDYAKIGISSDQFWIATQLYRGEIVPKNYKKAIEWFTKSAMHGHGEAQYNLGQMYEKGHGVIEDYVEAYKWYLLAGLNDVDTVENKNQLSARMTTEQIAEAQKRAKDFLEKVEARKNKVTDPNLN